MCVLPSVSLALERVFVYLKSHQSSSRIREWLPNLFAHAFSWLRSFHWCSVSGANALDFAEITISPSICLLSEHRVWVRNGVVVVVVVALPILDRLGMCSAFALNWMYLLYFCCRTACHIHNVGF